MERIEKAAIIAESEQDKSLGAKLKKKMSVLNAKRKKIIASVSTAATMWMLSAATAFADGEGGGGGEGGGMDTTVGSDQFYSVINFFGTWIGRIGLVVGFVGAVMFGLAIKNDDADAKTRGLMTLASGFVVFAITKAISFFMST